MIDLPIFILLFYLQQLQFSPSYSNIRLKFASLQWQLLFLAKELSQVGMKKLWMTGKLLADMFLISPGNLFQSLNTEQDKRKSKEW